MAKQEQIVDRKRIFDGSWFLVIGPVFACALRIWYDFGKQGLFDQANGVAQVAQVLIDNGAMTLDIAGWFIGGAIVYYFASLVPKDILVKRSSKYDETSLLSYLFNDSFRSYTIHYQFRDENGNLCDGASTVSGAWEIGFVPLKIFLWLLFLFAKASFVPYYAAFNLLRNYPLVWLKRIFSKKRKPPAALHS